MHRLAISHHGCNSNITDWCSFYERVSIILCALILDNNSHKAPWWDTIASAVRRIIMVCQLTALLSSTVHLWHGEHHERASPFPGLVRIPIICSFIRGVSSRQAVTGHRAKCGTVKSVINVQFRCCLVKASPFTFVKFNLSRCEALNCRQRMLTSWSQ